MRALHGVGQVVVRGVLVREDGVAADAAALDRIERRRAAGTSRYE
jgi:hypothetical protein